jgi:hypothetical protein
MQHKANRQICETGIHQLLSAEEVKPSEIINTRSILLGGGESNVQ